MIRSILLWHSVLNQEITPENVLAMHTAPLADSHVDTIYYCTISAGELAYWK